MNISKILALSMLCGVFASCKDYSDDIMADMDGTDAISFSAISQSGESRAAVADVDTLKKNGFKVYAYVYSESKTTVEPLIDGVDVEYVHPNWTYSPIAFWPTAKDATVNFYAIYNDTTGNANTINGWDNKPHTTYTVNSDVMKQSDFLWAAPYISATQSSVDTVKFNFKHALSGLKVSIPKTTTYSDGTNTYNTLKKALEALNPFVGAIYKNDYIHSVQIVGTFPQRGEIIPNETDINKIWQYSTSDWTEKTYTLLADTAATAASTTFAIYKDQTSGEYKSTDNGMLTVFPCGDLSVTIIVNHVVECTNGDSYAIQASATKVCNFSAGNQALFTLNYDPTKFITTSMKKLDTVPTIGIESSEFANGMNAKKQ